MTKWQLCGYEHAHKFELQNDLYTCVSEKENNMTMNGVWMTNTHAVNVSVHDWDENDCLVTVESVRQCFDPHRVCKHDLVHVGQVRVVPRYAVEDFSGAPLIRRPMKEKAA